MIRILFAALLVVALAACVPFQPDEGEAEGVTLTRSDGVFVLTADPPVLRALLLVSGENLTVDHEDCEVSEGAVECSFGPTESETVEVGGEPGLADAVVFRDKYYVVEATEAE